MAVLLPFEPELHQVLLAEPAYVAALDALREASWQWCAVGIRVFDRLDPSGFAVAKGGWMDGWHMSEKQASSMMSTVSVGAHDCPAAGG